ncbi:MAG: hypothetical protein KJZ86_01800, partial [Caldilineaceae bacterium]|nr:hypothetical protein [Caldilineaceae bacterium]
FLAVLCPCFLTVFFALRPMSLRSCYPTSPEQSSHPETHSAAFTAPTISTFFTHTAQEDTWTTD